MGEQDPGVGGPKISKSGDVNAGLEARNKSYNKVLDAQIAWIRTQGQGKFDAETEALERWKAKSAWHEKEYGF